MSAGSGKATLQVVAAALVDTQSRILIAERPVGKAQSGRWEFPGGKIAPGETPVVALCRELREELGMDIPQSAAEFVMSTRHEYADRQVAMTFFIVTGVEAEPRALDGQRLEWLRASELLRRDLLEADLPFVGWLQRRFN